MERKYIEDGHVATSLLIREDTDNNRVNGGQSIVANSGSAATAVVVFTTLIAVCGSYVFGAAVSTKILLLVCMSLIIMLLFGPKFGLN